MDIETQQERALAVNPYAPTIETAEATDDDSIRQQHLSHEA